MENKPNIILILADDMGYSDLVCYGSEIRTPNIDSLAEDGIIFSQMYNSARCCPSRAALLTGLNPHQAGIGHMVSTFGIQSPLHTGPYQGYLNKNCATIAEVLRISGYSTYMSGKWHVGGGYDLINEKSWSAGAEGNPIPTQRGFDEFFGIVAGAANYFHPRTLMKNDTFIDINEDSFYLTDAISDQAVSMINNASQKDNPFFMHIAYTAPHWPLHALEEDIAKYEGTYKQGWDSLRANRHEELKGKKILDTQWDISPRNSSSQAWKTSTDKTWEDLRMAVYAAMIDRMDQGIGKILKKLRELNIEDNTILMFLSDNGGCAEFLAEDSNRPSPSQYSSPTRDGRSINVGNRKDLRPGPDDTFMSYDLSWANASNSPFRLFKRWTHEGGISTPFIISWPNKIKRAQITHSPTHIIDIATTIYEITGANYPDEMYGQEIKPLEGESFYGAFENEKWQRKSPIFWEHEGSRAVREGEWKLVCEVGSNWEIYNMSEDRTELTNLLNEEVDRVHRMKAQYRKWSDRCEVLEWPVHQSKWDPKMISTHAHSSG